jgi:hypothetical protein
VKMLKRYISQRCLGYQKNSQGDITHSVLENHVELQDGTQSTVWTVHRHTAHGYHISEFLEQCPRIDIAVETPNPQI